MIGISARHAALIALFALAAVTGCKKEGGPLYDPSRPDVIDGAQDLTRGDYANLLKTQEDPNVSFRTKGDSKSGPPIPDLAPILAAPPVPKLGATKLVSITVTDDVPLKDVLLELARLADVDIEVDAGISGGISFRAKDRPFNEVIERIASIADLRYKMNNGVLRVERDSPYVENYPIDFVNIDRTSQSSVNISTNVLSSSVSGGSGSSSSTSSTSSSANSGGGGGGLNTGSQSSISAKSDSDFWTKFEDGIKQILSYKAASLLSTPRTGPAEPTARPAAPAGAVKASDGSFYILNRQGGNLTVSASERQHALIREFIKRMQASTSAQVLIEAKIVEVTLSQQFESGIDWNRLGGSKISYTSTFGGVTDLANIATFNITKNDLTGLGIDLDLAVRLAENFGTTRTLSSPRLHAINNQQAVLTFAENQVYFQVTVDRETTTSTVQNTTLTVNSEIKTVPIGIILMIQPTINLESNEVTLNVRPTLSRVTGFVSDPAVAYLVSQAAATGADLSVDSRVPVVEVRELDSILKLKSGQVMVIGGLMENKGINSDSGVPYASDIPVFGNLFKGVARDNQVKELVIFIRATIMDSRGNVHDADKAVYQKFTTDPRPLDF